MKLTPGTGLLVALCMGCAGAQTTPQTPVNVSPPPISAPQAAFAPSLVGDDGALLADFDDGPATLVSLSTRCVGEVSEGRLVGCPLERVRVALAGDAVATLLAPQSDEAPALAVDAPLRGGFPGHSLRFAIGSGPGDALCPGSPTRVQFFDQDRLLGEVSLDAAVPRQLGQGVVALLVSADEVLVLLSWARDSWALVKTNGDLVSEGHFAPSECECCE